MATTQVGTNSPTLTISNVTADQDGYEYYCVVRDSSGQEVTSQRATLTVTTQSITPVSITSGPVSPAPVTVGQSATFSVNATGTAPITYQWYTDNGTTDVFSPISGATNSSYTTPSTTINMNGWRYYCIAQNGGGQYSDTSVTAVLTVEEEQQQANPPVIDTFQVDKTTATVGETVTFTMLLVSGDPDFTYTWYRRSDVEPSFAIDEEDIKSSLSDTYTTSLSSGLGETWIEVYCVVSNAGGSITSSTIRVEETVSTPVRTTNGLISLWNFNEGTGTTINDTVTGIGTPLNLRVFSGSPTWNAGYISFNTDVLLQSDPADVNNKVRQAIIDSGYTFTAEVWTKPYNNTDDYTYGRYIFSFEHSFGYGAFTITQNANTYKGNVCQDDTGIYSSIQTPPNTVDTSKVQHIVMTVNGSTLEHKLYIDGVLSVSQTLPQFDIITSTSHIQCGAYTYAAASTFYHGDVHLASIYNRVLTDTEINDNYQAGPEAA